MGIAEQLLAHAADEFEEARGGNVALPELVWHFLLLSW